MNVSFKHVYQLLKSPRPDTLDFTCLFKFDLEQSILFYVNLARTNQY